MRKSDNKEDIVADILGRSQEVLTTENSAVGRNNEIKEDLLSQTVQEEMGKVVPDLVQNPTDLPVGKANKDDHLGSLMGTQLALTLQTEDYLPVMIFGAPKSGKTTFLISLIKYMLVGQENGAQIKYDSNIIPHESSGASLELQNQDRYRWEQVRQYAASLFNIEATSFIQLKKSAQATNAEYPFFLPLVITPKDATKPPLKIAFLEGQGEWYRAKLDDPVSPHQEFKPEIRTFLEEFHSKVVTVFIAPFVSEGYESAADGLSAANSSQMTQRDFALNGIIEQFENIRINYIGVDAYLYLLTKWDIRCGNIAHSEFIYNDPKIVIEEVEKKFPMSFTRFDNVREYPADPKESKNLTLTKNKKTLSAFSAGVIRARVNTFTGDIRKLVDHYPRKMWDYLYFNKYEKHLYKEFEPQRISLWQKITRWFTR